ncbi:Tol biopolymer transport system, TolR protein [hydrothermal vent metagenome]|uniref:Tol biopolymer transport system, TolR protein n=1 Tax=hydrothermal vent metagenome TaxID=652676 RepID=A0A3B0U3N2_9ZZZZ
MSMSVAGGGSGGGRRRRRKRNAPMSEINVTPMVDVMLVLLIVFMVAAPLLTVGVPVDLPETQAQSLNIPAEPVTLSVTLTGEIFIGDEQFSLEQAIARVNEMVAQDSEQRIYVRADTSVDYGEVMRVMGALSAAGHSRIGLVTAQETGR